MLARAISVVAAIMLMTGNVMAEKTAGDVVDDVQIAAQVKTNLIDSSKVSANDVNVEVEKGVVQLSGFVATEEERIEAGKVAGDIIGVKSVSNKLVVKDTDRSIGTVMGDQMIETKVNAALMSDQGTDAGDIDVEVREGVVQLSGFVSSEVEKQRAGEIAQGVKGVKDVHNSLDLKN
jgi:hyperosmotically inducible protein